MTQSPPQPTGKSLFSLHYLTTRLPALPEWQEDAQAVWDAVAVLWQKAAALGANWNEAQTEEEFIKPVLKILGWRFVVQAKSVKQGRINRPDYALFADAATRDAAYAHQGDDAAFYGATPAIAEAKYWGRPLSKQDASGRDAWKKDNNPSYQMVAYLVGTHCAWGILTNGQVWRLYSRDASSTASEYYEVDLADLFASSQAIATPTADPLDAFKRWWLFFRCAAFTPDSQGRSFVQRVYEGSTTYAREISDKLKNLVFREVMPEIAGGFVAYRRRELGIVQEDAAGLQQIYQASLSLLYKLLFVLYAEARSLLPVTTPAYWEESLTRMAQNFAAKIDRQQAISDATHATRQYDALLALFRRIDLGDADLGVPRYDGGLFAEANPDNQFLRDHRLSDRAVARAVDILVRDAGEPVDYAYLTVRNLGSIYEGLLENKLEVVDAAAGAVVLVNDKGERKATGSFYTPDYIVAYNVEQTLTPILAERAERFAAAMEQIAALRRKLARANSAGQVATLRPQLARAERAAREAFLGIKVCDSSMGSAHFLVNTVDFITDAIIEQMQRYHDAHPDVPWEWNPIQQLIEQVRREIVAEMAQQDIAVDAARLDDTALLTRLVMKRCIYGVDLNPMAVELAKLSLWLHSFTVGAPLSFLDHHLRCGNSLIGADVRTVEAAIQRTASGQFGLFAGPFAGLLDLTGVMIQIAEQADSTLADVRRSAQSFADFQAALTPYKQVLDLWVSQHFGNRAAGEFLTLYGADVLPVLRGERAVGEPHRAAIERAKELWQEKRFFHWDLEFPEVFIDLARRDWAENPGFDVMVGNPPYVRQEQLATIKGYLSVRFVEVYAGTADLFVYFFAQGLRLLRQDGRLAYISSNSWLRANYAKALRAYLRSNVTIETLVDIGDNRVFADAADVYPAIPVVRKTLPPVDSTAQVAVFTRGEGVQHFAEQVAAKLAPVAIHDQPDTGWQLGGYAERRLFAKLMAIGRPLGEVVEGRLYCGIKTALSEAFVINQLVHDAMVAEYSMHREVLKPMLRGEDLRPWYQENEGRWLILIPAGWTNEKFGERLREKDAWEQLQLNYPAIANHLLPFAERACRRQDQGRYWWELRSCDYYPAFQSPKILWPDIAKYPRFSWDESGWFVSDKGFLVSTDDPYFLGILQSRCTWLCISELCITLGERAGIMRYQQKIQFVSRLPIPDAPAVQRSEIGALALAITGYTRNRYTVHRQTRHRILTDLGAPGLRLNQRLTEWWNLDFSELRREVKAVFKRDIPLKERDEWESWLAAQRAAHERLTAEIVRLETTLNAQVYALFDLTPDEIKMIEDVTKYSYGEV